MGQQPAIMGTEIDQYEDEFHSGGDYMRLRDKKLARKQYLHQ